MDPESVEPGEERLRPEEVLLLRADGGRLRCEAVRVVEWHPHPRVSRLDGAAVADGADVLLLGHDATPDLEGWVVYEARGRLRDGVLDADPPRDRTARMPGLLTRWRRERELERGCRQGLRASGA